MMLPLLTKNNTSLGILYLVRDLQKNPFTTHTMRRIESLRRSLVIAIEKLEMANKNQKRKEVDVKGVPKKTSSAVKLSRPVGEVGIRRYVFQVFR